MRYWLVLTNVARGWRVSYIEPVVGGHTVSTLWCNLSFKCISRLSLQTTQTSRLHYTLGSRVASAARVNTRAMCTLRKTRARCLALNNTLLSGTTTNFRMGAVGGRRNACLHAHACRHVNSWMAGIAARCTCVARVFRAWWFVVVMHCQ